MAGSISAAILAGGQSTRMGIDKAFVEVGGMPVIVRIIERLRGLGSETVIIANSPQEYIHLGLPVHVDLIPGKGPLGGLYTALSVTQGDHTLVVSCDQPFLNRSLLDFLLSLREGYDVVVPLNRENYPQSMHAVYSKACLKPIRSRLEINQLKVIGFFPDVRVREVVGAEIDRFDPQRWSFINVNTPEDLIEAQRLAEELDRGQE
jgi:molybdopterin-guanine dinucleotide biosynthesis protein A